MHYLRKSLLARLVVYFLLLSLLTVSLVVAIAFSQSREALQASAFDRLHVAATLKRDALTQWVQDQRRDLLLLAHLPPLRGPLQDLLRVEPAESASQDTRAAMRAALAALVEEKTTWREILLLSEEGQVVLSSNAAHDGEYRARDRYFTQGQTQTFVQKAYLLPESFQPAMTIATPLLDTLTSRCGVLALHLNLERMDRIILERNGLGTASESYLVDRYHTFLSSERFGREEYPHSIHSEGIDEALQGASGSGLYLNYTGTPVLGVYHWLDDFEVALLVEIPQRVALAPARRLAWVILLVGLAVAIVFTMGTYLMARQIARPILGITDAALQVADGDLSSTASVVTEDEIGTLARTFNLMTGRLRVLYENLDQEITERKQVQEEREFLIADLETKNAELERFTYTVSHDLKSPLVTIQGFLGLLEQDALNGDTPRMKRDIRQIQHAAGKMQQLLAELLELSRIGRLVNPPEAVFLTALAHEAVAVVAGQIEERGVEVHIEDAMPAVIGDRIRLLEVFQNLLDNAVKFMGAQPYPAIQIGTEPHEDQVLFFVRDNGIGIDSQYQEKIFGLFERLNAEDDGTGIGLALVKRIVEVHGGQIWTASDGEGYGTTFYVTLPPATPALPAEDALIVTASSL